MNTEDRDYLALIKSRNDPDADKRWLVTHLEAEAAENEEYNKSLDDAGRAVRQLETDRNNLRDLARIYLENCDKQQTRAESAEADYTALRKEVERLRGLRELQAEQIPWVKHNFGDRPSWMPLFGAVEELGELAHAHLKEAQGIRVSENHRENARDAVADIIIYLADYASAVGFDLQSIVMETWDKVKNRDWKKNPADAAALAVSAPKEKDEDRG